MLLLEGSHVFCELLFTLPHTAASERKVVRLLCLEQTNSNLYVKLILTTIQEINGRNGSVGQSTLCARFARQNSKRSFQNYVAILRNIFKNVRGPLRSYIQACV